MQKQYFITQIKQNLAALSAFSSQKIEVDSPYFAQQKGIVQVFMAEIEKTAEHLMVQDNALYVEFYAEKLIKQFDVLNQAVEKVKKNAKKGVQFQSSFQFSPNVHRLSPHKRLQEYRKALRALNEKISWLLEQHYQEENPRIQQELQNQLTETEYRKMKCLKAIEDLEQEVLFR